MQNDRLKNEIAPWLEQGRWYHVHQTENGFDTDNTDKFILDHCTTITTGTYWLFDDPGIKVIDLHYVINKSVTSTVYTFNPYNVRIRTSQNDYNYCLLKATDYTELDADYWLFIKMV